MLAEGAGALAGPKTIGKLRSVFEGFELTLEIPIIIGHMRSPMGVGDSQVGQHKGYRLGGHRGGAVGVEVEMAGNDGLLVAAVAHQAFGQLGTFAIGNHPADHIATPMISEDATLRSKSYLSPLPAVLVLIRLVCEQSHQANHEFGNQRSTADMDSALPTLFLPAEPYLTDFRYALRRRCTYFRCAQQLPLCMPTE